jgi:putative acyl-CoA dehydrogenase
MLGPAGKGVQTIVMMVQHTRLDCIVGSAALMRRCAAEAVHHATHRSAFGKHLVQSPIMANVLADLLVEAEAATTLAFRVAESFDLAASDPEQVTYTHARTHTRTHPHNYTRTHTNTHTHTHTHAHLRVAY